MSNPTQVIVIGRAAIDAALEMYLTKIRGAQVHLLSTDFRLPSGISSSTINHVLLEVLPAHSGYTPRIGNIFPPVQETPATEPVHQPLSAAIDVLRNALASDPGLAWSWHCAVWSGAYDEGLNTAAANRAAARFMLAAFGVRTDKLPQFADTQRPVKSACAAATQVNEE